MATLHLPPRRRSSSNYPEVTIQRNRSSLDILMQMGFPKLRAEKALAATGDKGVQLASDWLLSHVNDPTLDQAIARDYILYLCPVGQLQQQLLEFWQKTYQQCGWNRAHNYFPHITLCSFFKSEDAKIPQLSHGIKKVGERCKNTLDNLDLEYFASTNFIGMFVSEECSPFLKQITTDFAEEAKKSGVTVEPHKKQLHISLAYQFPTEMKEKFETAAKNIFKDANVRWDLRLYSRDPRIAKCQVWKVICTHTPNAPDELDLIEGDFIILAESEVDNSPDGWYQGMSWLTGCMGMFPGSYTERTAETETWTMHRSIPIINAEQNTGTGTSNSPPAPLTLTPASAAIARPQEYTALHHQSAPLDGSLYTQLIKNKQAKQQEAAACPGPSTATAGASASGGSPKSARRRIPTTDSPKSVRRPNSASITNQQTPAQQQHPVPSVSSSPSVDIMSRGQRPVMSNSSSASSGISSVSAPEVTRPPRPPEPERTHHSPKHARRTPPPPGEGARPRGPRGPRQLYVIRHGERIDFTFGKDWIKNTFDSAGNYIRHDLNLPKSLPRRKGGPQDYSKDSPLTVQGHFQAEVIGEALREKDVPISHVYSSPSIRCVQTAVGILRAYIHQNIRNCFKRFQMLYNCRVNTMHFIYSSKVNALLIREFAISSEREYLGPSEISGLGIQREVHLEPGLFEWLGWYQSGLPKFLSVNEFRENGFNVGTTHQPIWPLSKYNTSETTEQYYERCHVVIKDILKKHETEGDNVLVLAHKGSIDVCTRLLLGKPPRPRKAFKELVNQVPFCAVGCVEEERVGRGKWAMVEPTPCFTHKSNAKYDWKIWK